MELKRFTFRYLKVGIELKELSFIKEIPRIVGVYHRVDFYQLIYVEQGEFRLVVDFTELCVKAGQYYLITPNQVCWYDVATEARGSFVLFTPTFFLRGEDDVVFSQQSHVLSPFIHPKKVIDQTSTSDTLMGLLRQELQPEQVDTAYQSLVVHCYLRALLLEMERGYQVDGLKNYQSDRLLNRFYQEVEIHFREKHQVSDYIDTLGCPERKLSMMVQDHQGLSPKAYIDRRLIIEAQRLLLYTELSAKEISYQLGFSETTNFIKFFRRYNRFSPKKFRETLLKD